MKSACYSKLFVHIVFAVRKRECLLSSVRREELFKYISGTVENKKCKSIIINGYFDHVHILVGISPSISVSDLVRDVKRSSSLFINQDKKWFNGNFQWQDGYGAFTYSKSQIKAVYEYIKNQEQHHKKLSFREEYIGLLKKFEIEYEEKYLFEFYE